MTLNIIDIAKLAGVSKSTVSRYLNNGYVGAESREKIKKVIDETGFMPQSYAKSLRTGKTNLIGVIVPKLSTETAPRVVQGITEVLSENNYDVLIANTNLSVEKEFEYLNIFKNNQVDGVIFMGTKITPKHKKIIISVKDADKQEVVPLAQRFEKLGYEVYATRSTADVLRENGVDAIKVNKIHQEAPTVMDLLLEHKIDIVIDTPTQGRDKNRDGFLIRRTSIETGVNCFTSLDTVDALLTSLESDAKNDLSLVDIATIE